MQLLKNKCYGCKERYSGCHSSCNDYKLFTEELDKIKREKRKNDIYNGYMADKHKNMCGYVKYT